MSVSAISALHSVFANHYSIQNTVSIIGGAIAVVRDIKAWRGNLYEIEGLSHNRYIHIMIMMQETLIKLHD